MVARSTLLGIALALLFLILAFWKTDLPELLTVVRSANYSYVVLAALATLCGYLLRTLRWQRILRPTKAMRVQQLFPILMIGFMANNILPARAGEIVRVYVLRREASIGKTLGLATIVIERLLDGLTLVLFVGLLSLRFPLPEWGTGLARLAGVVFIGLSILVGVLLLNADLCGKLISTVVALLPKRLASRANGIFESALLGLRAVQGHGILPTIGFLSIAVWLLEALSYYLIISGFNVSLAPAATPLAALFVLVVVNLAIMLPSAPGYVGTFQAFAVLALGAFGVQREPALGIAIVSHGMQYLLVTSLGLLFLWRRRMGLRPSPETEGAT